MENKRIASLDLIKTIAILMVLALHVPLFDFYFNDVSDTTKLVQYLLRLLSEGVPLFLMVNGFLLLRKKEIDIKKHVQKILKLLLILFVWTTIYFLVAKYQEGVIRYATFKDIMINFLSTTKYSDYTSQFWFVESLIAIYLVYPLLWNCFRNNHKIYKYVFIVVCVFSVGIGSIQLIRNVLDAIGVDCWFLNNLIWFSDNITLTKDLWSLFYFMLGGTIYMNYETFNNKRNIYVFIGLLGALLSWGYGYLMSTFTNNVYDCTFNYGSIFMAMFSVGVFALCIKYENKGNVANKTVSLVAKNTFGIYLINKIMIHYVTSYIFLGTIVNYIISVVVSLLITVIINKIPGIKRLINL